MTKFELINLWRENKIKESIENHESMFMGIPDRWFEDVTFVCENLHVSTHYLKSEEKGDLCLACYKNVRMCPPKTTEEQLFKEIKNLEREQKIKRILK